ncbi:MAG TPA: bifunctional precorrin-2 dehydrogenase/sirohydrochlorin ferrochelatase [Actinomycetota bacterium]|nr:bifunctional precorrin-2 dehydrogenase/sirohydrochlorin ferrochelatase [Actinomycetota bacterium]
MIEADLYVACINLSGRRVLVVGAGPVAVEKIEGLLTCAADITVVAPEGAEGFEDLATEHGLEWHRREYEATDLEGCFLVVAATSNTELNKRVHADAEDRSMLVNVVDVPELCNFILPAIVRRGPLTVAISTSGASPALAKRLKREISEHVGSEHVRLAQLLDEVRDWAKANLATYNDRKDFFEGIVNGDPDPIELLRRGDEQGVRELIAKTRARLSG